LRKFLSEPLVHFALIGVALFVLYQGVSPDSGTERKIVVTAQTVALLTERFSAVWMRQPTATELTNLIDTHIKEEILYREGVAMGLDRNDKVIQRRVLQKLEVLGEETSAMNPPTDAELREFLRINAARYAIPPTLDLQQIMFNPTRHGENLQAQLDTAMQKLRSGVDPATLGDRTLLPARTLAVSSIRLARDFGRDFVDAVLDLPVGSWQGPVQSGYGVHLVRVDNKTAEQPAKLADIRAAVERDWDNERRNKTGEAFYQNLLKDYDIQVEIDLPDAATSGTAQ
jgi:hypothetical protein